MIGAFPFKLFITKNIKFMKKYFFMAVAILIVSAAAIVGYSICQNNAIIDLVAYNIEALTLNDTPNYRYPNKEGKAIFCTYYLYINIDTNTTILESDTENSKLDAEVGITIKKEKKEGLKDRCPSKGNGCNPYSCQAISYQ